MAMASSLVLVFGCWALCHGTSFDPELWNRCLRTKVLKPIVGSWPGLPSMTAVLRYTRTLPEPTGTTACGHIKLTKPNEGNIAIISACTGSGHTAGGRWE